MPKVTLEFEVTQKGATFKQVAGEAEVALVKIKQAAGGATEALVRHAGAGEKANLSMRDMKQAIGALATSFGQVNPTVAMVGLELGNFTRQMTGASAGSKLLGAGVVAAGGAIGYFMAQFKETERIAQRFATIGEAVNSLDTGAIRSGIKETRIEIETMSRQGMTFVGSLVQSFDNARRMILGLPPAVEEARRALNQLLSGLDIGSKLETRHAEAVHAGEFAGLRITAEQQRIQNLVGRGVAGEIGIERAGGRIRDLINQQAENALQALESVWEKEIATARPELAGHLLYMNRGEAMRLGGQGAFGPDVQAATGRYRQAIETVGAKADIQVFAQEERDRQLREGLAGRREQQRASGAGLGIERQNAVVEALRVETAASQKIQAARDDYMRKIGVPAWMIPTVNTQAIQLIDEEKKAMLMGIDETLRKNLFAIDQLKGAEEDRNRLSAEAMATAEMRRQVANADALTKTNELRDATRKLREDLLNAGLAVRDGIGANMERAAASARDIVDNTSVIGMPSDAFRSSQPGQSAAWQKFWGTPETGPGSKAWWSGGAWGNNAWDPLPPGTVRTPRDESPVPIPGLQHGGFIPGPIGAPRLIVGHGGEVVLNPEQQASINPSFAPSITINIGGGEDPDVVARKVAKAVGKQLLVFEARGILGYRKKSMDWTL